MVGLWLATLPSTIGVVDSGQTPYPGHYLDGVGQGFVTSSSPAIDTFPAEGTFVLRVAGPAHDSGDGIACVSPGFYSSTAWVLTRTAEYLRFAANSGGGGPTPGRADTAVVNSWRPETIALSVRMDNGSGQRVYTPWSFDGSTWTSLTPLSVSTQALFTSAEPLRIGVVGPATSIFRGQIFWVELRTGLNPADTTAFTKGHFTVPAAVNNYLSTPTLNATSSMCIVARIRPTSWNATRTIVSKWRTGALSWAFRTLGLGGGALQFFTSVDGAATTINVSSGSGTTAAFPIDWKWVAVTFTGNDGVGGGNIVTKFWTSDTGSAWTQVGATNTIANITTIFNSASLIDIGAIDAGLQQNLGGDIQHLSIRSGTGTSGNVGGTEIFRFDGVQGAGVGSTSFVANTGQTVTINRAASDPKTVVVPNTGLLWRFDASEHSTGTSWTDPRGRAWTVTPAASSIVHAP